MTSPQPLSSLPRGRSGRLWFSHLALEQMPGQSLLIAQTITKWAYVEAAWGAVLAKFLSSEAETAIAMYSALNGWTNQRTALEGAARFRLSENDLAVFQDVLRSVMPFATTRHHFAHWLWGSTPTLFGYALLVEPQHVWNYRARVETTIHGDDSGPQDFQDFDRSVVQVWSPAALMHSKMNVELAVDIVAALLDYLNEPKGPKRDHICSQLYAQEIVARARKKRLQRTSDQQEIELLPRSQHTSDVY